MAASLTERMVNRLANRTPEAKTSRRGFLGAATLGTAALTVSPWRYLTEPADAYTSVCGPDAECSDGYSVFCCTINGGHNTCPPNTFAGGWWKADRSSYCGGGARYYIDCNAKPGYYFHCHCNTTSCDHRLVACNVFRYGQCNTQIHGVTPVVCRKISCRPPWELYPTSCGHSSATDNNTAQHTAPCLNWRNTYPPLRTFPYAHWWLRGGYSLMPGQALVSADRHTMLYMGHTGGLGVHNQYGIVWESPTSGKYPGGYAHLWHVGQLVIRDASGKDVWATPMSHEYPMTYLHVRNSGDVQLTPADSDEVLWHTDTHTS